MQEAVAFFFEVGFWEKSADANRRFFYYLLPCSPPFTSLCSPLSALSFHFCFALFATTAPSDPKKRVFRYTVYPLGQV